MRKRRHCGECIRNHIQRSNGLCNAFGTKKKTGVVNVQGRKAATDFSPKEKP